MEYGENGMYKITRHVAPISKELATSIDKLLCGYGEHYPLTFGKDYITRCSGNVENVGVLIYVAEHDGEIVSHASVLYSKDNPTISTLHNIFTAVNHRKKGLSTKLVSLVLQTFDTDILEKNEVGYMVLGTGSPSAAKIYSSHGFEHLAGGLDTGNIKGYNPDDVGEWIMIRNGGTKKAKFDAKVFYAIEKHNLEQLQIIPCELKHYTQLVLLFNAFEKEVKNILSLNIITGIQAEGGLVGMYTSPAKYDLTTNKCKCIFLCVNTADNDKVIGLASFNDNTIRDNNDDDVYNKKEAEQVGGNWEIYSISKKSEKKLRDYCMSMKA